MVEKAGFISGSELRGLTRGSDTQSPQLNPPADGPKSSEGLKQHVLIHM